MRSSITLVFGVLLAIVMAACNGPAGDNGNGRLKVVATTTQVGSIAREIGADAVDLTVLLAPGAEAHDYEMTPSAAAAVEDADLLLRSGAGLESWLDEALETIGGPDLARDMSHGVSLHEPIGADEEGHDEHAEDEHGLDPHYWLSAPNAMLMVANVRDALIEADPENAATFEKRAAELLTRLEEADAQIRAWMAEIPDERRAIVSNHDALGYFIEEYGLRFVGSIFPSLDVAAEPSAGELAALVDTIRDEGVAAIFSESAVNPDLAEAVAAETGAIVVEDPLYTDSLGPDGSGAESLDGMLLHNADVIRTALAEN